MSELTTKFHQFHQNLIYFPNLWLTCLSFCIIYAKSVKSFSDFSWLRKFCRLKPFYCSMGIICDLKSNIKIPKGSQTKEGAWFIYCVIIMSLKWIYTFSLNPKSNASLCEDFSLACSSFTVYMGWTFCWTCQIRKFLIFQWKLPLRFFEIKTQKVHLSKIIPSLKSF